MRVRAAFSFHAIGLMATVLTSSLAFGQADWTQRFPTNVPLKRMYPAMAQFGSCSQSSCGANVVMFGGLNLGPPGTFNQFNALADTWVWNGTDWTQVSTPVTPSARYGASMTYDFATGSAVLFGGETANGQFLSDTWLFNSETFCLKGSGCAPFFSWTQVTFPPRATTPPGRAEAVMATKPGSPPSEVVLTGGVARSGLNLVFLNDTWIFNTGTKTWTQTVAGPPGALRRGHGILLRIGLGHGRALRRLQRIVFPAAGGHLGFQLRPASVVRTESPTDHAGAAFRPPDGPLPGFRFSSALWGTGISDAYKCIFLAYRHLERDLQSCPFYLEQPGRPSHTRA